MTTRSSVSPAQATAAAATVTNAPQQKPRRDISSAVELLERAVRNDDGLIQPYFNRVLGFSIPTIGGVNVLCVREDVLMTHMLLLVNTLTMLCMPEAPTAVPHSFNSSCSPIDDNQAQQTNATVTAVEVDATSKTKTTAMTAKTTTSVAATATTSAPHTKSTSTDARAPSTRRFGSPPITAAPAASPRTAAKTPSRATTTTTTTTSARSSTKQGPAASSATAANSKRQPRGTSHLSPKTPKSSSAATATTAAARTIGIPKPTSSRLKKPAPTSAMNATTTTKTTPMLMSTKATTTANTANTTTARSTSHKTPRPWVLASQRALPLLPHHPTRPPQTVEVQQPMLGPRALHQHRGRLPPAPSSAVVETTGRLRPLS
ncbi:hypothetical protein PINS_up010899 [Pythium insidiosum]|nr:hypothetical protein PINS_up010899 [Pythium insidiosum]